MKVVRRGPNKFWIFLGGKAFVLRIDREIQLVPRWRVAGSLLISAMFAGVGLSHAAEDWRFGAAGGVMFLVALFLAWAAGR